MRGLFALAPTGVSPEPIRRAADAFVASLTSEQKARALFGLDTSAWRAWSNIHPWLLRHGVALDEMSASSAMPRSRSSPRA